MHYLARSASAVSIRAHKGNLFAQNQPLRHTLRVLLSLRRSLRNSFERKQISKKFHEIVCRFRNGVALTHEKKPRLLSPCGSVHRGDSNHGKRLKRRGVEASFRDGVSNPATTMSSTPRRGGNQGKTPVMNVTTLTKGLCTPQLLAQDRFSALRTVLKIEAATGAGTGRNVPGPERGLAPGRFTSRTPGVCSTI